MKLTEHFARLIEKYEAGTATQEEIAELNAWYHSFDDTETTITSDQPLDKVQLSHVIKERISKTIRPQATVIYRRPWFRAAAVVLVLLLGTVFYYLRQPATSTQLAQQVSDTPAPAPVVPGGNKALLTLSDGSTIILDSAANGLLSTQGNIKIQKLENGLLAYELNGKTVSENDAAFYNTITTPRGGQYKVTLSDGTTVWLNAASSIRFPVIFTGAERVVEVTGETYFEVAKNAAKPFRVKAVNQEVEVLGTHFNINAYSDEASIKTTLLEGKVKVSVPGNVATQPARFLKPGQQSGISKTGQINIISNADTEEAVAWIKGRFQFDNTDLRTMLRQFARWYDVEVEYRGPVDLYFTGQLTRNEQVTKVFKQLELTGEVHFRMEGRKVIVTR
jgi:ferric-dicitrate binding protein FerR (iron transport regulator)